MKLIDFIGLAVVALVILYFTLENKEVIFYIIAILFAVFLVSFLWMDDK